MIKLILITIIIVSLFLVSDAQAVTGEQIRFDWTWGQPTLTDDVTNLCNNQAVSRFDWVWGQPSIVYDVTATCTATVASNPGVGVKVQIQGGQVIIRGGQVIIR